MSDNIVVKRAVLLLRSMLKRPSVRRRTLKLLVELIDTYSDELRADGNYDRFCSKCGHTRIHRSNTVNMCTDCYVRYIIRVENQNA